MQCPVFWRTDLDEYETRRFRQWARDNYKVFSLIQGTWHPVVQAECVQMNLESGYSGHFDLNLRVEKVEEP